MPVTRAIHIIGNDRGHGPDDDDRDIDRRMGRGRGDGTQGRRRSGRSRVEAGSRSEPGLRLPLADVREEGTHTSASTAYTAAAAKHHSRAEQVALQQQREDANREERSRGVLQRLHRLQQRYASAEENTDGNIAMDINGGGEEERMRKMSMAMDPFDKDDHSWITHW